jgi:flavin reductase (DIM6/NTAB) family NADH-FMN oxidoreductase RutF
MTPPRRAPAPPPTSQEFREVIGHFACGVTVVTAMHDGRARGTTASALSSLSLEPPMVVACLNRESETGRVITIVRHFAVSILREGQDEVARHFARKGVDKLAGFAVTAGARGDPLLTDALATLECRVTNCTSAGTHWVFLAEVERASASRGLPLTAFRGRFGRLTLPFDDRARAG